MPGQVFVSEYVTGGAWADGRPPASLRREGRAMLGAAAADFARVPGVRLVTTWDRRLGPCPLELPAGCVVTPASPGNELRWFQRLAAESEATFVIAPEFDGILAARRRLVDRAGGRYLGSPEAAIRLTADKLRLAEHLARHGIRTIPTRPFHPAADLPPFPFVVKPRDGAGSQDTFLVDGQQRLREARRAFAGRGDEGATARRCERIGEAPRGVWQPYVAGLSVSVAAIVGGIAPRADAGLLSGHAEASEYEGTGRQAATGTRQAATSTRAGTGTRHLALAGKPPVAPTTRLDVFPPAMQRLSDDGRFRYLGGRVPAATHAAAEIEALVRRVCACLPGLAGYVGFDLVLPSAGAPVLVEVNPRLTTSYLGYRRLAVENLAERLLFPERDVPPLDWRGGAVDFRADGVILRPGTAGDAPGPP